jgi:hypothetical protein
VQILDRPFESGADVRAARTPASSRRHLTDFAP